MLQEKLALRKLPDLTVLADGRRVLTPDDWRIRRAELLGLLSREEYGQTPAAPGKVTGEIIKSGSEFAGKAELSEIRLTFETPGGPFSFPMTLAVPRGAARAPVFVCISFRPWVPDKYLPAEEIIDHGFAFANFCYEDVTSDSETVDGIGALYPRDAQTGWGTIGMWAFAASRVLDYLETREDIDSKRACVSGHSRLGKTALWCAAQDERFAMAVSNDSGCSGAALSRGKIGETVDFITHRFPYWFCGNYQAWSGREYDMPFDQHMLLALIAPRRLYVCSAEEDSWADPESEFLSCAAASEAWSVYRLPGLAASDALPETGRPLTDGSIAYHVRAGSHFFSRTDWQLHMAWREQSGV